MRRLSSKPSRRRTSGLLYPDPRTDRGAGFDRLLARLASAALSDRRSAAAPHVARFSGDAFRARIAALLAWLSARGIPR
jgi:hypothetical protein